MADLLEQSLTDAPWNKRYDLAIVHHAREHKYFYLIPAKLGTRSIHTHTHTHTHTHSMQLDESPFGCKQKRLLFTGIPIVSLAEHPEVWDTRAGWWPSFVPYLTTPYTDNMSFPQRFHNLFWYMGNYFWPGFCNTPWVSTEFLFSTEKKRKAMITNTSFPFLRLRGFSRHSRRTPTGDRSTVRVFGKTGCRTSSAALSSGSTTRTGSSTSRNH